MFEKDKIDSSKININNNFSKLDSSIKDKNPPTNRVSFTNVAPQGNKPNFTKVAEKESSTVNKKTTYQIPQTKDEELLDPTYLSMTIVKNSGWPVYNGNNLEIKNDSRNRRVNLTKLFTFTIDSDTSQDLDDALSIELLPHGLVKLYVHISDVDEAVPAGSYLDKEAEKRTTSLYLPGLVVPMLPFSLSHDRLSLLPDKQRKTLTVELLVDGEGKVVKKTIYQSTIKSNLRLDYSIIAPILSSTFDRMRIPANILEKTIASVKALHLLSHRISQQRVIRGGLNFEQFFESAAEQSNYDPVGHEIIERIMVLANEQVALWLEEKKSQIVYRAHPSFTKEDISGLTKMAQDEGLLIHLPDQMTPLVFASLLSQIKGHKAERKITKFFQKKLSSAYYTHEPSEHFGLGSDAYLHFTSPIRRYSDLLNHRLIKQKLNANSKYSRNRKRNPGTNGISSKAKIQNLNEQAKLAYAIEQKCILANKLQQIVKPKGVFEAIYIYTGEKGDYYKTEFTKIYALHPTPEGRKIKRKKLRYNQKNRFIIKELDPLANTFTIEFPK